MTGSEITIAVTGARGLLGSEVVEAGRARGHTMIAWGRAELDVTDADACHALLRSAEPDWVVHCAAYTAVDRAESEPDLAMRVNGEGTRNVARACAERGSRLLYVSSDYVFDGRADSPYTPSSAVGPRSSYGRSKLAGEVEAAAVTDGRALIVRTGWLYGRHGSNFVDTMVRLASEGRTIRVVDDQVGRPTWAFNVASALIDLVEQNEEGIHHVADSGTATWFDFASGIFRIRGLAPTLEGVSTEEWGAPAPRPAYSVLSLTSTEKVLGRSMQAWPEALNSYLSLQA